VIGKDGVIDKKFTTKHLIDIDTANFGQIVLGMQQAVVSGTAAGVKLKDITICGKTGTAQNPHGANHSVFIAFAPKNDPKIAIAVYVENAGFGATYAAPIGSLMIEKYIKREITNKVLEKRILDMNLEKSANSEAER
jgi:penicillin-binding protein 2